MKKFIMIFIALAVLSGTVVGQENKEDLEERIEALEKEVDTYKREQARVDNEYVMLQKDQWGQGWGLDISGGNFSGYSTGTVSLLFPKINNHVSLGVRGIFAGTFVPQMVIQDGKVLDRIGAWNLQAAPFINTSSAVMFNFIRIYGGFEVPIGSLHSFGEGENKYGINVSVQIHGYGGLEVYASSHQSFFLEAGGGGGPIFTNDDSNLYIQQSSLYGGAMVRLGSKFYF